MISNRSYVWLIVSAVLALAGCASTPEPAPADTDHSARYTITQDRAPTGNFDASGLSDAVPVYHAPVSAGNKSSYTVWGKQYSVMNSNDGYVARGTASWYGEKFHGHKTSNGETFDMYKMSAAHKSLRIPGYARVTNVDNNRSVIVRVNDRGPFHGDRLIDLSYAAAKKLGYQSRGTARVQVESITVKPNGSMFIAGQPFNPSGQAPVQPAPKQTVLMQQVTDCLFSLALSAVVTLQKNCRIEPRAFLVTPCGCVLWIQRLGAFTGYKLAPFKMKAVRERRRTFWKRKGFRNQLC